MRNAASSVGPSAGAVVLGSSILGVLLAAGCGLFEPTPTAVYRLVSIEGGHPLPVVVANEQTSEGERVDVRLVRQVMYLFRETAHTGTMRMEVTAERVVAGVVIRVDKNVSRAGVYEIRADTLIVRFQFPDLTILTRAHTIHDQGRILQETLPTSAPGKLYRRE